MADKKFNLEDYETVETRLARFHEDYPTARVTTEMVEYSDERVVFKAFLYKDYEDEKPTATGFAEETRGEGYINKTSHLENCETSAIGRALANAGYAPKGARPSREEMQKVANSQKASGSGQPEKQTTSQGDSNGFPDESKSVKQALAHLHNVLRKQGHKNSDKQQIDLALALGIHTLGVLSEKKIDNLRRLVEKDGMEKTLTTIEANRSKGE